MLDVPKVTVRDVTGRPETIECGSNVLAGCDPQTILNMIDMVTRVNYRWQPPSEYFVPQVAGGHRMPDLARLLPRPRLDRKWCSSQVACRRVLMASFILVPKD
jgi:hypothetical protein